MTKGLALSGGGALGSFQVGALWFLYDVLGYRPDVIASTSVGSINALALAQGKTADEQLAQLKKLLRVWRSLNEARDFYIVRQWFKDLTMSDSIDLSRGLGGLSARIEHTIAQLAFNNLIGNAVGSPSLAELTPLEELMKDPDLYNETKLAAGIPLRMVCVSMESGRVRYTTGRGMFIEDDNVTPVASALPRDAAIVGPHDTFTSAVAAIGTIMAAIENQKRNGAHDTKWRIVAELDLELERARWRADAAFDALAAANAALRNPIEAYIGPVLGALASSALPGIFGPYTIGSERYVDGGVRENVPVRTTIQMGATEVIAVVCAAQKMPHTGYPAGDNFLRPCLAA